MASQQVMIQEAVLGISRRLAREKEGAHNSDNEAPSATNRQNKLKRRAEFYHFGELGGRMPYKRKIEHASYNRYILKYNPRRYDEEGYELDSEEEDSEADREAEEKNPYKGIKVEETLGPLTHVKDLQSHPAMSQPYKSKALPSMIKDTLHMVHRERKMLVDVKHLLEPLRGDQGWVPAGSLQRGDDTMLFGTEVQSDGLFAVPDLRPFKEVDTATAESLPASAQVNGTSQPTVNGSDEVKEEEKQEDQEQAQTTTAKESKDKLTASENADVEVDTEMADAPAVEGAQETGPTESTDAKPKDAESPKTNGLEASAAAEGSDANAEPSDTTMLNVPKSSNPPTPSAISSPTTSPPRMLTRGRAAATNGTPNPQGSRSASPVAVGASSRSPSPPPLHPLYITSQSAGPDRDLGLPAAEAEELRRLLSAYAQKQEEVCRGADRLHRGLLKASRLRDTVWWWARAEEHCGELSDGEDWVDLDEWQLDAPLRKGNETGVDEAAAEEQAALGIAALSGKKTRGRRVAG